MKLQAHANGQKYAAGWQLGFDSGTSVTLPSSEVTA
ncbi:DUF1983 domain-containing protein [Pseudomonas aeruginosa]